MTQIGLCALCTHARIIESKRGSRFWMCTLSRVDPHFPKYPPLPVVHCSGHTPGEPSRSTSTNEAGGNDE
jgi:hypothetical protein